jgi:hypothetical protein
LFCASTDRGCEDPKFDLVAGVAFDAIATLDQAVATSRMPRPMVSVGFAREVRIVLPLELLNTETKPNEHFIAIVN